MFSYAPQGGSAGNQAALAAGGMHGVLAQAGGGGGGNAVAVAGQHKPGGGQQMVNLAAHISQAVTEEADSAAEVDLELPSPSNPA